MVIIILYIGPQYLTVLDNKYLQKDVWSPDVLSVWTFCPHQTFCPAGCFVCWTFCLPGVRMPDVFSPDVSPLLTFCLGTFEAASGVVFIKDLKVLSSEF